MDTLKQKILTIIEKNSRIDMKELAVLLGTGEKTGQAAAIAQLTGGTR